MLLQERFEKYVKINNYFARGKMKLPNETKKTCEASSFGERNSAY
jgi:hypothetical protein